MLTIRLLGRPSIERDGQPVRPPRGRKAWALLAYLLLAERPPSRRALAELLFADADDPLGALRWTLAELRRALGLPDAFSGDPVRPDARRRRDRRHRGHRRPTGERRAARRRRAAVQPRVRVVAAGRAAPGLGRGRGAAAARPRSRCWRPGGPATRCAYASRAVARNPLDEGNHELLVRGLAMAGDRAAARRQVAVCEDLLRRELGIKPSPALRDAADVRTGSPMALPLSGRAAAASQLDAGRAAIVAGAVDAGLQCLRRAVVEAERCGDAALHGRALAALGGALVHAVARPRRGGRGRPARGDRASRRAAGDRATAVTAHRELGFVEVQAGRRTDRRRLARRRRRRWPRPTRRSPRSSAYAGRTPPTGATTRPRSSYLRESVERAERCGDRRQQAWSLSMVGPRAPAARRAQPGRRSPSRGRWSWSASSAGWRSCRGRRRCGPSSTWPPATSTGPPTGSSRPGCSAASSATRAGRAWPRGASACCTPAGATTPRAVRWLGEAATRCEPGARPLPVGARRTCSTPRSAPPWTATTTSAGAAARHRAGGRWPPGATCASSSCAHTCTGGRLGDPTALASARLLAADIDNPALADLMRAA